MARLNILVSALAVSPDRGSEWAIGWQYCAHMGRYHDVTIIYRWDKIEVERHLSTHGPISGVTFIHNPDPFLSRSANWLRNHGLELAWQLSYNRWQLSSYRLAKRLISTNHHYNIVHQLNGVGIHHPGYMWQLPIPFVWGPTACGPIIPKTILRGLWRGSSYFGELARNFIRKHAVAIIPMITSAARHANHIWVATDQAHSIIQNTRTNCLCKPMSETGCQIGSIPRVSQYEHGTALKLLWSGTHIPPKALPILLKALALIPAQQVDQVIILGDGPETSRWRELACSLGINSKLNWKGQVPFSEVEQYYKQADAFIFTSVREGTPHVVMESLCYGLPVVTHDCCGMHAIVADSCGIKVPYESLDSSIKGFAATITRLYSEKGLVRNMSQSAIQRAKELSWENIIRSMANIYSSIANNQRQDITGITGLH